MDLERLPFIVTPERTPRDISCATGVGLFASDRRMVGSDLQDLIAIPSTRRPGIRGASSSRWDNTSPDVTYRINTPLPTCAAVTAMTAIALCVYDCHIVGYRTIIGGDIGRCVESKIADVQGVSTVTTAGIDEGECECLRYIQKNIHMSQIQSSLRT